MKSTRPVKVGLALMVFFLSFLPSVEAGFEDYHWYFAADVPRLFTYAEGRRNVFLVNEVEPNFENVQIFTQIQTDPGQHAGIVFRCDKELKNYYEVLINVHRKELRLSVYENGKYRVIKRVKMPELSTKQWYDVLVWAWGPRIEVEVDQLRYINVIDSTLRRPGHVGMTTYHKGAKFARFLAWEALRKGEN